ncbi:MAG: response regulator, partial [bacterium]|nr:response regulator [bacterium]
IDGEQVLKILKKENDSLPIIILSGYLTKDKIIKLSKLGVKGFLTKPIDIKNFYQVVNQVCPINIGK